MLTILAMAALGGCSPAQTPIAQKPANIDGKVLHREGHWMVDSNGRVVLLHGVNVVWKIAPYFPPDSAPGFTAADADFLSQQGFNVVRLGVLLSGVMPQSGVVDTQYLDQINRIVQLLAARKIWVLLDFHQDMLNEKYQGEGLPPWAVNDDGLPNDAQYGFPANEFLSTALNTAFDNFWNNKNNVWTQYAAAWAAVAQYWRNQPYLLGYDLFNEPWPGTQWPTCFEQDCRAFDAQLQTFFDTMLAAVRSEDTVHFAFFEPQQLFDFGAPSNFSKESDPAIGLSWHDYCSVALTASANLPVELPDCGIIEPKTMNNAAAQVDQLGAVSLMTEFGASDDTTDIARVANLADQHLVGWTYWAYKYFNDPTGSGQAESLFSDDSQLSTLKSAKADILIRPYAQATAGIPASMSFDASTQTFQFTYTPNQATAPTVIFIPKRHYPHGYVVNINGGKVTSVTDAARLTITNNPGATSVQIEVAPR